MKIGINFHTSDKYISGVEYYSLGLINSLLRLDEENRYVVFTNQPDLVRTHIIPSKNLTVRNLDYLKTRPKRILWEHLRLPQVAEEESLDILHCPHYVCPFFNTTIPYVVTIHDTIAIDHPRWCKPSNALYYNLIIKQTIKKTSKIIVPSHNTADNLKLRFSVNGSKVSIFYPGIDSIFNTYKNNWRQNQVKIRYNLPEQYILSVGNIEPKKNLIRLLQAYKLLRKKGLPHKLALVGKRGWKNKNVLEEISKITDGDVILTGYVERPDLPFVYQMAEVFVFVSLYEGFGFPPLEAMACGIPVAASTSGALKETIGESSYNVDPTNPEDIAQAAYLLITNNNLRQKYIESGLKESQRFSWDNAARQTLSVYKEALKSRE
jgi:glycosyltransferase involved in cell wall biosynthesis